MLACFVIAFAVGSYFFTVFFIDTKYQSTTKFCVDTTVKGSGSSGDEVNALLYAQRLVNTYIGVLDTNDFYSKVSDEIDNIYTAKQLSSMISFSALDETEIFQSSVVSLSPADCKKIADAVEKTAPAAIENYNQDAELKIIDSAQLPSGPISPNTLLNTLVGGVIGFILGLISALIMMFKDISIKSEDELEDKLKLPILAYIPDTTNKL